MKKDALIDNRDAPPIPTPIPNLLYVPYTLHADRTISPEAQLGGLYVSPEKTVDLVKKR
jgi:hypothetical protein